MASMEQAWTSSAVWRRLATDGVVDDGAADFLLELGGAFSMLEALRVRR
jgi:hypothetical protein